MNIPGANQCGLYGGGDGDYIPFDKLRAYFERNLSYGLTAAPAWVKTLSIGHDLHPWLALGPSSPPASSLEPPLLSATPGERIHVGMVQLVSKGGDDLALAGKKVGAG